MSGSGAGGRRRPAPDPGGGGESEHGRVGVAIPAAGVGRRMGGVRKAWLKLGEEPVLLHAIRPFLEHPEVTAVRVALGTSDLASVPAWLTELDPRVDVVAGGATRAESVRAAVRALPDVDVVLVHDAARPLVDRAIVDRCLDALADETTDGVVAGVRATDTIKVVGDEGVVVETPPRATLWHAQTPQGFRARLLRDLLERIDELEGRGVVTDDASLFEIGGFRIVMVEGSVANIKVTHPDDVVRAELLLAGREEMS